MVGEKLSAISAEPAFQKLFDSVDSAALGTNVDLIQSFQETIVNQSNYYSFARDGQACRVSREHAMCFARHAERI